MLKTSLSLSTAALIALAVPTLAQNQTPAPQTQTQTKQAQSAQTKQQPQTAQNAQTKQQAQTTQRGAANRAADANFYSVRPADVLASDMIGMRVYNAENENIGEIEDLVIDNNKDVKAVVLGVGGFLGVGERKVAVEPGSVMIEKRNDGERAVVHATKQSLTSAPEFKRQAQQQRSSQLRNR
jgi:ribosomal 30S subunit maturation factor RimM